MKFYRNERIEEIAEQRLREFEGKLGCPLSLPVDIELFGDLVLGLSMLWENIDELPGEEVLAGLRPADRPIVMNEGRKQEMEQQAGRRRLTQGHENTPIPAAQEGASGEQNRRKSHFPWTKDGGQVSASSREKKVSLSHPRARSDRGCKEHECACVQPPVRIAARTPCSVARVVRP